MKLHTHNNGDENYNKVKNTTTNIAQLIELRKLHKANLIDAKSNYICQLLQDKLEIEGKMFLKKEKNASASARRARHYSRVS